MKKKLCATSLSLCVIVSLTACGAALDPAATNSVPSEDAEYESAEGKQIKVTAGEVEADTE